MNHPKRPGDDHNTDGSDTGQTSLEAALVVAGLLALAVAAWAVFNVRLYVM